MSKFGRKKAPGAPPWHPDFRDAAALPDVKVVRTSFFVNAFAILVLVCAVLLVASHEIKQRSLRAEILETEKRLSENRSHHEQVLRMQREFDKNARLLSEVSQYAEESLDFSGFLVALGTSMPRDMMLSTVRYLDSNERGPAAVRQIQLAGAIQGTPDSAASIVTEYVKVFETDPVFAPNVEHAVPTSLVPAPETDLMGFGIQITLKKKDAAAAGKEAAAKERGTS